MTIRGRTRELAVSLGAADGDAGRLEVAIAGIAFADGTSVTPPRAGVTVLVGPNNAGKSASLRQIQGLLLRPNARFPRPSGPRLVDDVQVHRAGTLSDVFAWLGEHAHARTAERGSGFARPAVGLPADIDQHDVSQGWADPACLGGLTPFFVFFAGDTQSRQQLAVGTGQRQGAMEPPVHPLHILEGQPDLERHLSELSDAVFGEPLVLDRLYTQLNLKVGRVSVPTPAIDNITEEYQGAMAALPLLSEQGDGMRSFLGLLLPLITAAYPIVLIDEAEAFLHPPQATALGRELARLAQDTGTQVILATHDRPLLGGLLEAGAPVSVVRLSRAGDDTSVHQLDPGELRSIWADPALRYTNVLDGLFHRLVVLAEGDGDCRFYAAALDAAHAQFPLPILPTDVLFVPAGDKHRLAALTRVLRALNVDVRVTADFDVLRDERTVQGIVDALSGEWAPLSSDWAVATSSLRTPRSPRRIGDIRPGISAALGEDDSVRLTKDQVDAIKRQLSVEDPWAPVKRQGVSALPPGQETAAAFRLLDALDALGLVVVRSGELESFGTDVEARKGPPWLTAALNSSVTVSRLRSSTFGAYWWPLPEQPHRPDRCSRRVGRFSPAHTSRVRVSRRPPVSRHCFSTPLSDCRRAWVGDFWTWRQGAGHPYRSNPPVAR